MSCGVGRRCGLDPRLLWLWCRLAAVALIQSLAWELPYAMGVALKSKKQTNKQTKRRSHRGTAETNLTRNQEVAGFDPWPHSVG